MASQRMIRREKKRIGLQRFNPKRQALLERIKDPELDIDAKIALMGQVEKVPRDASPVRLSRRCRITGRARGVLRKFGLGRSELRRRMVSGEVPGLVKASW